MKQTVLFLYNKYYILQSNSYITVTLQFMAISIQISLKASLELWEV